MALWELACERVLPLLRDQYPDKFHELFVKNREFRRTMTESMLKNVIYESRHLQLDECVEVVIVHNVVDAGTVQGAICVEDRISTSLVRVEQLPLRIRASIRRAYADTRILTSSNWDNCTARVAQDGRLEFVFQGNDFSILNTAYYDVLEDVAAEMNYDDDDDEDDPNEMPIFPESLEWDSYQVFAKGNLELIDHNLTMQLMAYFSHAPDEHAEPILSEARWQRKPRVRIVNFV